MIVCILPEISTNHIKKTKIKDFITLLEFSIAFLYAVNVCSLKLNKFRKEIFILNN